MRTSRMVVDRGRWRRKATAVGWGRCRAARLLPFAAAARRWPMARGCHLLATWVHRDPRLSSVQVGVWHRSAWVDAAGPGCCALLLHKVKCSNSCWRAYAENTFEREYYVCTTAPSHPAHRSGYLGSRVRPEAASAPRAPHQSRHRLGGTPGSRGRAQPWRQRWRRRQWACSRHVTILNLSGQDCNVEAHFLPLTFKGQSSPGHSRPGSR
jgi:hypothetical protein